MTRRELERAMRRHNADMRHDAAGVCPCDEAARLRAAMIASIDRIERQGQREAERAGRRRRP